MLHIALPARSMHRLSSFYCLPQTSQSIVSHQSKHAWCLLKSCNVNCSHACADLRAIDALIVVTKGWRELVHSDLQHINTRHCFTLTANTGPCTRSYSGLYIPNQKGGHVHNEGMHECAGNVGNLPLVIVATLCDEKTSLFARDLGAQCGQVGIAYVAFSMWVAGFVQYSVAYNMMKLPPK